MSVVGRVELSTCSSGEQPYKKRNTNFRNKKRKMATPETICKFNQSGFCKFQSHCRKHHIMEICPNHKCTNMTCVLRHPKLCKYFTNFRRCKFEESCAYLHGPEHNAERDENISELEEKIENIKAKLDQIDSFLLKLDHIETRISSKEEICHKNNEEIEQIKKKLDHKTTELEEVKKILDEKSSQHDELALNFNILMNAVDDLEKSSTQFKHQLNHLGAQIQTFHCNLCGEAFRNEQTLRSHIQRNHGASKT